MKLSYKDVWCLTLLTAIQLGYSVSFDEGSLRDYLSGKKSIPHCFITTLEKETASLSRQICIDGLKEQGDEIESALINQYL